MGDGGSTCVICMEQSSVQLEICEDVGQRYAVTLCAECMHTSTVTYV